MWGTGPALDRMLGRAALKARELGHREITLEHLAWAVLIDPDAGRVLRGCGGDPKFLAHELDVYLRQAIPPASPTAPAREPRCRPEVHALLERVILHAVSAGLTCADARHVLVQLWNAPAGFARGLFEAHGIARLTLLRQLSHGTTQLEPDFGWRRPGARGYLLVLHNDDFTTREFVVQVLHEVLAMEIKDALEIMMRVHRRGRCKLGPYEPGRARASLAEIHRRAAEAGFPLRGTLEPA